MVTHPYNLSTQETEAGGSRVQSQSGLQNEFTASLDYIVRPCLKKKKKKKKRKKCARIARKILKSKLKE
jgi:hypothetical protein